MSKELEKEFDFSDFDDEVAMEELDFSDFDDELSEEEVSSQLKGGARAVGTGAAIYGAQKGIEKSGLASKVKDTPMKALSSLGELERSEIEKIMESPDAYKKGTSMNELVTDAEDIEQSLQKGIFSNKKLAEDAIIKGNLELPKDQLVKKLESVRGIQKYRSSEKGLKANEATNKKLAKMETRIAPVQEELGKLENVSQEVTQKVKQSINQMDEDLLSLEREILSSEDSTVRSELNKQKKELTLKKRELKQKSQKLLLDNNKTKKTKGQKLERLKSEYSKLKSKSATLPKSETINVDEISKYADKEKQFLSNIEAPKGQESVDFLKRVRSDADYNKALGTESFSNKAAKQYGKEVRGILGEQSPRYDKLMKGSSEMIEDRKQFASLIGLKGNTKTGENLKATNSTVSRLERVLKDPESPDFKQLQELSNKYNLEEFLTKAELAGIESKVQKATGLKNIRLGDILKGSVAASVVGPAGQVIGPAIAAKQAIGTKAQELLALASQNKLVKGAGKIAGTVGKGLLKSLPLIGAAASYSEAQAADMSPLETAGYIAGEELNPLPISLKEMYDAKAEISIGDSEKLREGKFPKATQEAEQEKTERDELKLRDISRRQETYNELKDREVMSLPPKEGVTNSKDIIDSLKNLEKRKSTIESLRNMSTESSQQYADELEAIENNPKQNEHSAMHGLIQQPAFRELMRRAEKKNGNGSETN